MTRVEFLRSLGLSGAALMAINWLGAGSGCTNRSREAGKVGRKQDVTRYARYGLLDFLIPESRRWLRVFGKCHRGPVGGGDVRGAFKNLHSRSRYGRYCLEETDF